MIYGFMLFLCFLSRTAIGQPTIELIGTNSSTSCRNFTILEGNNFQSVTFKVTGDWGDSNLERFNTPQVENQDGTVICLMVFGKIGVCTEQTILYHTCTCENKTGGVYHLTVTSHPSTPLAAYKMIMTWTNVPNVVRSEAFIVQQVRVRRNCWVPTIEILNTAESTSCSHDYLVLGTDYQTVKFNISWSNTDYTLDSLGTPTVLNSSSGGNLCPLIGQDNKCLLREFEDYSCLCEEITPDEYHLTFKFTPKQTGDSFPIHVKWRGQNEAKDIISEKYILKDVKEKDCAEGTSIMALLGVGIGILILIVGGFFVYKFALSEETAPNGNAGMDADKMLETESTHVVRSDETIRRSTLVKVTGSAVDFNPSSQV